MPLALCNELNGLIEMKRKQIDDLKIMIDYQVFVTHQLSRLSNNLCNEKIKVMVINARQG